MKGAAFSTERSQDLHWYCIWWRRVGGPDRFRHWVLAESIDHAISRSHLNVSKALATNAGLWNIEEPRDKATRGIRTEVVWQSEGPQASSHRVRIVASVLILLCLLFLFGWRWSSVASAEPMPSNTAPEIIPEVRSENHPGSVVLEWLRSVHKDCASSRRVRNSLVG
jgi:hypothetical protein